MESNLKKEVISRINFEQFYTNYIAQGKRYGDELSVMCPFHHDRHPSMSINVKTGFFKCHAGDCNKDGDVFDFYQLMHNVDFKTALIQIAKEMGISPGEDVKDKIIPAEIVKKYQENLWSGKGDAPKMLKFLKERCQYEEETIRNFELGYDFERITIPVKNSLNVYVNIRRYLPGASKSAEKMLSYKQGYGQARLFPIENLDASTITILEGERDCILANQLGYKGITATAGAGTFKDNWIDFFKDKNIVLVYDIDKAGQEGARKVALKLSGVANEIKIVKIPLEPSQGKDLTDYIVGHGFSKSDLDALIANTKKFYLQEPWKEDESRYDLSLAEATKAAYVFKKVKVKALIAGKDLGPFSIPKKVRFLCRRPTSSRARDWVDKTNGSMDFEFQPDDRSLLELIGVSKESLEKTIFSKAEVPQTKDIEMQEITHINVEQLMLIPEITSDVYEYVRRDAYFLGTGLESNRIYIFSGKPVPFPKSQYAVLLVDIAEPADDNISSFKMTEELKEKLTIFQSQKGESVKEKFYDIANDLAYNVTKIFKREDLHIAIDLIYHSVLTFNFLNDKIDKGYSECLILGETRCISGDSYVFTDRGLIQIKELEKQQLFPGLFHKINNLNVRCKEGKQRVNLLYKNKKQQVIKITTRKGFSIKAIPEHPIYTTEGFQEFHKLKTGDFIAIKKDVNLFGKNKMPLEKARLLGYLIGDGYIGQRSGGHSICVHKKELDLVRDLEKCLNVLNLKFSNVVRKENENLLTYYIQKAKILDLPRWRSGDKEIPEEILKGKKEIVKEFLRGYFETDGHHQMGIQKSRNKLGESIEIVSKSRKLINQTQLCLLNFGIVSSVNNYFNKRFQLNFFRLNITGNYVDKFFQEIGFVSGRKNKRIKLKHKTTLDTFPHISELLKEIWKEYRKFHPELAFHSYPPKLKGLCYGTIKRARKGDRHLQKKTLDKFLELTKEISYLPVYQKLKEISKENIFWDKIVKIEEVVEEDTYDFFVPKYHNFVANGFINHNSGKSRSAHRLLKFYKAGELVPSGESASVAGLLGGLQQLSKNRWVICISGDSYIFSNKGLKKIEEFKDNYKNVMLIGKEGKIKGNFVYDNGIQNTIKLKTNMGYELEGTHNHPILIIDKNADFIWKRLDQLEKNDYVCIQRNMDLWNEKSDTDSDFGELLGHLIGDGCITNERIISFSNKNLKLVKRFCNVFENVLGKRPTISMRHVKKRGLYEAIVSAKKIRTELFERGILFWNSHNKEIPKCILEGKKETIKSFLSAYFESDGCYSKAKKRKVKGKFYKNADSDVTISLLSASEKIIKQLQVLLLNFGIISKKATLMNKYSRIIITGENIEKFRKEINFLSKRKRRTRGKTFHLSNVDRIPYLKKYIKNLWEKRKGKFKNEIGIYKNDGLSKKDRYLKEKGACQGLLWRAMHNSSIGYYTLEKLIRETFKHLKNEKEYKVLNEILSQNFFFDKIKSLEKSKNHVYDFVELKHHSFNSNGFISHNSWGKIPLSDRRLLIIDEVSGMNTEAISHLSGVRSEGEVELTKIQKERTTARTRMIWLSNARSARSLRSFGQGIKAIPALIGKPEDIARFDFAIALGREDISEEEINSALREKKKQKYSSELCNRLILWAWSRTIDQVMITDEATDAIIDYASRMVKKYSSMIPLVTPLEQKVKLARLGVACAARLFSTEDGETLIVKKEHIDFVYEFLEQEYCKKVFGYDEFSRTQMKDVKEQILVKNKLVSYGQNSLTLVQHLLIQDSFGLSDLEDFAQITKGEAKDLSSFLVRNFAVFRDKSRGYRKNEAFIDLLKEIEEEIEGGQHSQKIEESEGDRNQRESKGDTWEDYSR